MRTHNNRCTEGFRLEIEAGTLTNEECVPTQKNAAPEISKKDSANNLNILAAQKMWEKQVHITLLYRLYCPIFFPPELVGNRTRESSRNPIFTKKKLTSSRIEPATSTTFVQYYCF